MTKYILNSGGLKNNPDKADKFHQEIIKDLGDSPRLLFCFFAQPREYWEEKFTDYSQRFLASMDKDINPQIELAFTESFISQLKASDAVIIYGGDDNLLLYYLKQYKLPTIWEGKVVAGSSAGSDALVKHFWASDWRRNMDGLGILPIKFIPHYQSNHNDYGLREKIDWQEAYQDLKNYEEDLPIYALKEGEYIVIEQ
jgi:peptidase E